MEKEKRIKKPVEQKSPKGLVEKLLLIMACAVVGFGAGWLAVGARGDTLSNNEQLQQQIVSSESELNATIAENVSASVVSIDVTSTEQGGYFFQDYQSASAGTGIIISKDGYIVTNKHVIPDTATEVSVTLSDGTTYDNVTVVGRDPRESVDIAFLKIKDVNNLTPAKLGDSSKIRVGEKVVAIGNALGQFQNTVTTGVISGLSRPIVAGDGSAAGTESLTNLFQTDAAINPGNSGGPLVNVNSEVIGINTAVAGEGAQNIGFAIPIGDVKGLIAGVLATGKLQVPYLGVRYIQLNKDIAYEFNLDTTEGAYIWSGRDGAVTILPGSPADKAGLREKDIITKVNETAIDQDTSLVNALSGFRVSELVTLTVIRDGQEIKVPVTLEAAPER